MNKSGYKEIVIRISDYDYQYIKDKRDFRSLTIYNYVINSIANGIPLPKGHGDLVDIRPLMRGLYEEKCVGELTYTTSEVYKMLENEAPTIIEADKE